MKTCGLKTATALFLEAIGLLGLAVDARKRGALVLASNATTRRCAVVDMPALAAVKAISLENLDNL